MLWSIFWNLALLSWKNKNLYGHMQENIPPYKWQQQTRFQKLIILDVWLGVSDSARGKSFFNI